MKLTASDGAAVDWFDGVSVSIYGTNSTAIFIVGAVADDDKG